MSDYTEHLISMAGGDGEPDLDAIQARADAATKGPWEAQDCGHDCCFWVTDPSDRDGQLAGFKNAADAALFAAARTDVPALLAVVRSQQAKIKRVEALVDEAESGRGRFRNILHTFSIRAALTATEGAE